jgi:hypothetical protein
MTQSAELWVFDNRGQSDILMTILTSLRKQNRVYNGTWEIRVFLYTQIL